MRVPGLITFDGNPAVLLDSAIVRLCRDIRGRQGRAVGPGLISHKVFSQSFCKSPFPHKSVNLLSILVIVKNTLTDLWGS